MKKYEWNEEKNKKLKNERNISFEEVVATIRSGKLIAVENHPRVSRQQFYIIQINSYAYVVPFVIKDTNISFLKTIYRSRKMSKKYLKVK